MRTFLKPLSFLPALFLMYMIFSFSAQEGEVSAALSYKVSHKIVETADQILDAGLESWEIDSLANRFHGVTRKLAHMTEYFALAIAVAFPLYVYGMHGILLMITAGLICVAFACGDEYHQSFVAGRGPSKRDVLIDSFGVFWGIIVVRIVGWTGRKTIFRPLKKKSKKEKRLEAQMREEEAMAYEYQRAQYEREADYGYQRVPYGYEGNYRYQNNGQHRMNAPQRSSQRPDQVPPVSVYPPQQRPSYSKPPVNGHYTTKNPENRANFSRSENDDRYHRYPNSQHYDYGQNPGYGNPYPSYTNGMYTQDDLEEAHVSDKLSEDMSFRKLMHNLKDQRHGERS